MTRGSVMIAGVDLGTVPLDAADGAADLIVDAAHTAGIDPSGMFIDTHRIVTRSGDLHNVLAVSAAGAHDWQLWRLCATVMRRRSACAISVGRHSVGSGEDLEAARSAVAERTTRIAGRCVYFPGVESLIGTMTAGQIIAESAIDVVVEVGGTVLEPDAEIVTGGHVRPRWEFGALTLHVQHEGQGLHLPFEVARALPLTNVS